MTADNKSNLEYHNANLFMQTAFLDFLRWNNNAMHFINEQYNSDIYQSYKKSISKREEKLPFNIIELISHKWRYENFHSDILQFLLKTEDFLTFFLDIIKIEEDVKHYYDSKLKVVREEAYIDVFIKNEEEKRCIIIENKLNGAVDQDRQLARYYEFATRDGYIVDKIVYISPGKWKSPSEYSKSDKKKEIDPILSIIYGFDGNNEDLVACLENTIGKISNADDIETQDRIVFYRHYLDILKQTGVGDMSFVTEKFLAEIKEDQNKLDSLKYIHEMINNLQQARRNFFVSKLPLSQPYLNDSCYKDYDFSNVRCYLEIKSGVAFENTIIQIGKYSKESFAEAQLILEKKLEEKGYLDKFKKRNPSDTFVWQETFKAIDEDEKVSEIALELDEILSKLDVQ